MKFKFVHTADWQIGRQFSSFPEHMQSKLALARLEAIGRVAERAQTAGAPHVLVAGDVIDRESVEDALLRQLLARLAAHSALTWHLLPGNHDPERPGGLWTRVRAIGLPSNVRVYSEPAPAEITRDVWLLPAPLTGRRLTEDPTAAFDTMPTPAGALRLGLAHGSIRGFSSNGEASVLIDPQRARRSGLAYLALGDWHGAMRIDARTWYAGTPEPDRFPQNEPGYCLSVAIDGGTSEPVIERASTAKYRWQEHTIALLSADDLSQVESSVRSAAADAGNIILRLVLSGRLTGAMRTDLGRRLEMLSAAVAHLDADTDAVGIETGEADLAPLGSGGLFAAGQRLTVLARDGGEDARIAGLALRHLLELARNGSPP